MTEKVVGQLVYKLKPCTLDILYKVHAMAAVLVQLGALTCRNTLSRCAAAYVQK